MRSCWRYTGGSAALLVLLLAPAPAMAITGTDILARCRQFVASVGMENPSPRSNAEAGVCIGYLQGFSDGMGFSDAFRGAQGYRACIPNEVMLVQEARVLIKYLEDRPERLHANAGALYWQAMQLAFPCAPK